MLLSFQYAKTFTIPNIWFSAREVTLICSFIFILNGITNG